MPAGPDKQTRRHFRLVRERIRAWAEEQASDALAAVAVPLDDDDLLDHLVVQIDRRLSWSALPTWLAVLLELLDGPVAEWVLFKMRDELLLGIGAARERLGATQDETEPDDGNATRAAARAARARTRRIRRRLRRLQRRDEATSGDTALDAVVPVGVPLVGLATPDGGTDGA